MLHLVGYGPELARCVRCGKAVAERVWFGLVSGGILCPMCSGKDLNAVELSPEALKLLRAYESESIDRLRVTSLASTATREVSDLLSSFIRTQIGEGAKIKSMDFLERMRETGYA
jgi:DNA repair protein RecO (recombination protein O)